ncbi:MAG: NAD(P)-dependent oxidoreductase [Geminicoccaceae bacterium]
MNEPEESPIKEARTAGVVGLGIMGSAITANLKAGGYRVLGFDIEQKALDSFEALGGELVSSPGAVVAEAPITILSLPSSEALHSVTAGDNGIAKLGRPGQIVAECSTLSINDKEAARDRLADADIVLLDCPLSGTGAQAVNRDLAVYASGDQEAFERCRELFTTFARSQHYVGPFGAGMRMKLVANLLVAIHNVASAEAMVLGMRAGLDPEQLYNVIRDGAGTSRMFEMRALMMAEGAYEPAAMKLDVWQKDMAMIAAFAEELGSPVPTFDATGPVYDAALAEGFGNQDTAAVCAILQGLKNGGPKGS